MSRRYQSSKDVPLQVIVDRLNELSDAIRGGRESQSREFTMRIPAERDRDADLVIGEAATRITQLQADSEALRARVAEFGDKCQAQQESILNLQALNRADNLRQKAEAVDGLAENLKRSDRYSKTDFKRGMATAYGYITGYAQRLRAEASDIERGGSDA